MKNINKIIVCTFTMFTLALGAATPLAWAALGERELAPGTQGDDVRQLQAALAEKGFGTGDRDGVYGSRTAAAVQKLEKSLAIEADGVADLGVITALTGKSAAVKQGAAPDSHKRALDIVATAYASGPHDNGKWGSLTHLGTRVRPGIIAVDPRVIPLGARVYIEFADGRGVYATAEDTGGAIKGNRIDIAMGSVDEAYEFGMQKVKVYVL
ncbi:3D domain-containing protein [Anaeroselena agilis]|uniref:3D domain-containing protein n=1 Tax=Anaeroselena agilis TaxID=3063788 RepID=A0ABU3NYH7_9FIRM|nr:3D domain-containing protein [Selenomonadales bacterium 4137-cl]